MRRQLLLFVILVAAAGAHALNTPEQDSGEAASEVKSDSDEHTRKAAPAPAATFTPTEKIEADSAVSFPVDI